MDKKDTGNGELSRRDFAKRLGGASIKLTMLAGIGPVLLNDVARANYSYSSSYSYSGYSGNPGYSYSGGYSYSNSKC